MRRPIFLLLRSRIKSSNFLENLNRKLVNRLRPIYTRFIPFGSDNSDPQFTLTY